MKKETRDMMEKMAIEQTNTGQRVGGAIIHQKGNLRLIEAMEQRYVRIFLQMREEEMYGWWGGGVTCEWCAANATKTARHVILECDGVTHRADRDKVADLVRQVKQRDKQERDDWEVICNPGYYGVKGKEMKRGNDTAKLLEI